MPEITCRNGSAASCLTVRTNGREPSTYLDKPRSFGGGEDAVGLEPQVEALPLENLLVENYQLRDTQGGRMQFIELDVERRYGSDLLLR